MYAIIKTGGKQLRVEEGQTIWVEKLDSQEGDVVVFDEVLLVGGKETKIGSPLVNGATVTAKIDKQGKSKKIIVFKYKPKKHTKKKQGHRQPYTRIIIEKINA